MHLGIDFGTSYTKLGYWETAGFVNLAGEGNRIPSVATWLPSKNRLYFGELALRLNEPGAETARFFKLALKRNPGFCLGPFTLPVIIHQFFSFLEEQFISSQGITADSITLSVPNYFGLNPRHILLEAARQAFTGARIFLLPEPLAAVYGYNRAHPQDPLQGDILSIDVGGGTTDFSIVRILQDNRDIILETQFQIGNDAFSGSEIDRGVLHNILLPGFHMQTGMEVPEALFNEKFRDGDEKSSYNRLLELAEKVKIELGEKDHLYLNIPDFLGQNSLVIDIDRDLFTWQLINVYERFKTFFEQSVVNRAKHLNLHNGQRWELDHVFLQGGASQSRGLTELAGQLCKGISLLCPDDPEFNVMKGLSAWNPAERQAAGSLKSIYPFNFYIEKMNPGDAEAALEKIPFDTANLELDVRGRYKIFSFPLDSGYNLAVDANKVRFKIYEVEEDDLYAELARFQGQDLVWHMETQAEGLPEYIEIYLDLAHSRLESNLSPDSQDYHQPETHSIFGNYNSRQRAAWQLIKSYKPANQDLVDDFGSHLSKVEKNIDISDLDYTETVLYKVLCLLDFLIPG
ncbi:MAG: Hsp70 family protein [Syntrophomonas sp.]